MFNFDLFQNVVNASKVTNAANGICVTWVQQADDTLKECHNNATVLGGKKGTQTVQMWAKQVADKVPARHDIVDGNGRVITRKGEPLKPYAVLKGIGLVTLKRGKFHGTPWAEIPLDWHGKHYTILVFSGKMDRH